MKKKKKSVKNIILDIITIILFLIAIGCAIYIGLYYYNSSKNEKKFEELKKSIITESEDSKNEYSSTDDGDYILTRYKKLYELNKDFIGWLKINDTNIDYPVMYTPNDGEFYIHKDFDKNYSASGTLFIDERCTPRKEVSDNIIIYGHHMKSGTMFHDLMNYENEDFYKSHSVIKFDTLDGLGEYKIIAAFRTEVYAENDTSHYHYYDFINAEDSEAFDEFINFVKANTPYTIEDTATYGDELITLSTCAYHKENGRYVVVAKKIK